MPDARAPFAAAAAATAIAFTAASPLVTQGRGSDPFADLVQAERAFSAHSVREGMRAAFLHWFADSVVTFAPLPVRGTEALEEGPAGPHLEWWPAVAEISADGRMGYTTGPYRVPAPEGGEDGWGHYHSVWTRRDDDTWRVLLDIGGPHGPVEVPDSVRRPGEARENAPAASASAGPPVDRDRAYAEAYRREGPAATSRFGTLRARVYRPGGPPVEGLAEARAAQEEAGEALTWEVMGGGMAGSADLGYTWGRGTLRSGGSEGAARPMGYARIWRRGPDGAWRFVVEVVLAGG